MRLAEYANCMQRCSSLQLPASTRSQQEPAHRMHHPTLLLLLLPASHHHHHPAATTGTTATTATDTIRYCTHRTVQKTA